MKSLPFPRTFKELTYGWVELDTSSAALAGRVVSPCTVKGGDFVTDDVVAVGERLGNGESVWSAIDQGVSSPLVRTALQTTGVVAGLASLSNLEPDGISAG